MNHKQQTSSGSQSGTPTKAVVLPLPPGPTAPVAQSAGAYDVFSLCVSRAKNLLKIHQAAHGSQARPEAFLADAHRAAIVLSISALDAYVRTCCLEKIRGLLANKSQALPPSLSSEIKRMLKEDSLLDAARQDDLLSRVEKAFRQDFEKRSFQGVKNITDCLQLVGFEDIFHEVAVSASMNEDNLKQQLNTFTKRRHTIAHQGDYDLSQNPPVENSIRKKEAEECIRLVSKIAEAIHNLCGLK
jgi:hypothetical protein